MKVLTIGNDPKLHEKGSAVRARQVEYGSFFDESHIINFTRTQQSEEQIAAHSYVYPTNTKFEPLFFWKGFELAKRILNTDPTGDWVVTCQDGLTGILASFLSWYFKVPLHVQVHADIYSPHYQSGFKSKMQLFGYKRAFKRASRIRVVSERIRENIIARFPRTQGLIDVLPIFVEPAKFAGATTDRGTDETCTFIMVSRLAPEKQIDVALKALAALSKKYTNVLLKIVGSGPEEDRLKYLASELEVSDYVEFVPWSEDVPSLLGEADVFLQTSRFEGYGLALHEAALAGLPIITTEVGLVGSWLNDDNALVVPVGDEHKVAEAMKSVLINPRFRAMLATESHKVAPRLNKAEYLRNYVESFRLALKK